MLRQRSKRELLQRRVSTGPHAAPRPRVSVGKCSAQAYLRSPPIQPATRLQTHPLYERVYRPRRLTAAVPPAVAISV